MAGEKPSSKAAAKKAATRKTAAKKATATPAERIEARIKELDDWRGERLAWIRKIVRKAAPDVVEEWKYRGVPVWYDHGAICTGETYKHHVKMTFPKGTALPDPSGLFNGTTGGNTWRAIDIHEHDDIDAKALTALIKEAVKLNRGR